MTERASDPAARVVEIRPRQDVAELPRGTVRGVLRRTCLRLDLNAGTATWDAEFSRSKPVTMRLPGYGPNRPPSSVDSSPPEELRELVRCAIVRSRTSIDAFGVSTCLVIVFLDRDDKAIAWSNGLAPDVFDEVWPSDSFAPLIAAGVPITHEAVRDNWDLHKKYPPAVRYLRFATLRGALCLVPVAVLVIAAITLLLAWLSGS